MNKQTITWQEVRRMAVALEVRLHLAGLAARERWHALQPRVARLEQALVRSGERASEIVDRERSAVAAVLRRLKRCPTIVGHLLSIGLPARTPAAPTRSRSPLEDSGLSARGSDRRPRSA